MTDGAFPSRRDVIKRFRRPKPMPSARQHVLPGAVLTLFGSVGLLLGWTGWSWTFFLASGLVHLAVSWFLYQRRPPGSGANS